MRSIKTNNITRGGLGTCTFLHGTLRDMLGMDIVMNKVYSLLGLAKKAGQLLSGDETVERTIRAGKAVLVIVAGDASENTKDKFKSMCSFREVSYREFGEKFELGRCTGKEVRSVISIQSKDFKNGLLKIIDNQISEAGGEGIG